MATIEQLARRDSLMEGWLRVLRNRGGRGGDGVRPDQFAADLDAELKRLTDELLGGQYSPGPLRQVPVQQKSGKIRSLRIPCIRDRVVQTACHRILSEELDKKMSADSFGFRPERSVDQAVARVNKLAAKGNVWIADADIASFFDSVSHARLMDDLTIWVRDRKLIQLVNTWLGGFGNSRGLALGSPISPILANLFLHPLDRTLAANGSPLVRYADDFVVLTRSRDDAQNAMKVSGRLLKRRGLRLNPEKSQIIHFSRGFEFLGRKIGG